MRAGGLQVLLERPLLRLAEVVEAEAQQRVREQRSGSTESWHTSHRPYVPASTRASAASTSASSRSRSPPAGDVSRASSSFDRRSRNSRPTTSLDTVAMPTSSSLAVSTVRD